MTTARPTTNLMFIIAVLYTEFTRYFSPLA